MCLPCCPCSPVAVEKIEKCRPASIAVTVEATVSCGAGYESSTTAGKMSW